jgi:methyl-accepting chemotaxis protein
MIKVFTDRLKASLILTALFFAGIAVSAYVLFRLPYNLMIPYGFESYFNTVYIVVGITFIAGIVALSQAMKYKKEVIVYRDRSLDSARQEGGASSESKDAITIEGIKTSLRAVNTEKQVFQAGLDAICTQLEAGQGAAYRIGNDGETGYAELLTGFALTVNETAVRFAFGEGLVGRVAASGQALYLDEIPEGYIKIISGLGSASPRYVFIAPVKNQTTVLGVIEIATFAPLTTDQRKFVEQGCQLIAEKLTTN